MSLEPVFRFDMKPVDRCPLCRSEEKEVRFEVPLLTSEPGSVSVCATCSLAYLDPAPTKESHEEFLRDFFVTAAQNTLQAARHPDPMTEVISAASMNEIRVDELENHKTPPGQLLEVGCGYGGFLTEAMTRGWDVIGLELCEHAANFCHDSLKQPVLQGEFIDYKFPKNYFDVIVMLDVIEQFRNPIAALEKAARCARPGAVLYMSCPNAGSVAARYLGPEWTGWKAPARLTYFNYHTVEYMMKRCGWKPIKIKSGGGYAGQIVAFGEIMPAWVR